MSITKIRGLSTAVTVQLVYVSRGTFAEREENVLFCTLHLQLKMWPVGSYT